MTVTLELEPDVERTATEQAKEEGLPLAEYAGSVFRDAILRRQRVRELSDSSFDEILAPVRQGFDESGMTEDELLEFFEEVREEVYQEKLKAK